MILPSCCAGNYTSVLSLPAWLAGWLPGWLPGCLATCLAAWLHACLCWQYHACALLARTDHSAQQASAVVCASCQCGGVRCGQGAGAGGAAGAGTLSATALRSAARRLRTGGALLGSHSRVEVSAIGVSVTVSCIVRCLAIV